MLFIDNPRLRPYFYSGKCCPRHGPQRKRVITLAEIFADALESTLFSYRIVPSSGYLTPWASYCQYILEASPTLRDLVSKYPNWWPALNAMLPQIYPRRANFLSSFSDLIDDL